METVAERLRARVEANVAVGGQATAVSVGAYCAEGTEPVSQILARADRALYRAKELVSGQGAGSQSGLSSLGDPLSDAGGIVVSRRRIDRPAAGIGEAGSSFSLAVSYSADHGQYQRNDRHGAQRQAKPEEPFADDILSPGSPVQQ